MIHKFVETFNIELEQNLRMDETETVLYVCETMALEDLIYMTLEDLILSHVSIYVCVVSLITKLFP